MKKVLQPLFLTVLAVPSFVFAAETASAPQTTTVDKVLAAKRPNFGSGCSETRKYDGD